MKTDFCVKFTGIYMFARMQVDLCVKYTRVYRFVWMRVGTHICAIRAYLCVGAYTLCIRMHVCLRVCACTHVRSRYTYSSETHAFMKKFAKKSVGVLEKQKGYWTDVNASHA